MVPRRTTRETGRRADPMDTLRTVVNLLTTTAPSTTMTSTQVHTSAATAGRRQRYHRCRSYSEVRGVDRAASTFPGYVVLTGATPSSLVSVSLTTGVSLGLSADHA